MRNPEKKTEDCSVNAAMAEKMIKDYMGKSLHSLSVNTMGRGLKVKMLYYDFKPVRVVQRDIEDMIPNLEFEELYRDYKPETIWRRLCASKTIIYVMEDDGCLRPTDPMNFVYEYFKNEDLSQRGFFDADDDDDDEEHEVREYDA